MLSSDEVNTPSFFLLLYGPLTVLYSSATLSLSRFLFSQVVGIVVPLCLFLILPVLSPLFNALA